MSSFFTKVFMIISALCLALQGVVATVIRATDVDGSSSVNATELFHQTWIHTGEVEFLCTFDKWIPGGGIGGTVADCKAAMNDLLAMRGYWQFDEWAAPNNPLPQYEIYSYLSCKVYATAFVDITTNIGTGDIYALIEQGVKNAVNGNVQINEQISCPPSSNAIALFVTQ
ncbi:hypothetical protein F5Y16DRAFT_398032 [Xylariaceae sp. FL0255]|nr:hypothetical protein F5Y16DRAFT_398032 [Xylariaceae sp. FL0255]